MKKLSLLDKIVFLFNALVATMLLLSYFLPYASPKNFALLSVLSLAVPLLILLNILLFIYWLLKVKRQLLLSLFVLVIGYSYVSSLYKFSSSKNIQEENNISFLSYNVRLFNVYDWIEEDEVSSKIMSFIKTENPDVICFQEYHPNDKVDSDLYQYQFEDLAGSRMKHGQAIWSKFPIVNKGSIEFKNTANNAIFADIVKNEDTIRVYNVHLQSSGINADVEELKKEESQKLLKRVATTFKMQQDQAELFVKHKQDAPYRMIVCGDFTQNNRLLYKDVKIADDSKWQMNHWKSLQSAYSTSPFFEFYQDDIAPLFHTKQEYLMAFNLNCLELVSECLQFDLNYLVSNSFEKNTKLKDLRFLINAKNQREIQYHSYTQVFENKHGFINNLSILDLLFNEGPNSLNYLQAQSSEFF